ncbi:uncharacterized protein LOC132792568 [Drosophila nasuta]|uniref:uncharacterized protein LOC132792568 n=1 Tax=Drosophila nasuta TaxID=42062 RepID=UPI00295EC5F2|nr:uncharacterized protein LOC132792568 [Drosophila nasuta]
MKVSILVAAFLGIVVCPVARAFSYDDFNLDTYKDESDDQLFKAFENRRNDQWNSRNYFSEEYEESFSEKDDINNEFKNVESYSLDKEIPAFINWTHEGVVSPVENQGNFKNSWAFAAAGVIESRKTIKTGKLVILSKQNLVDCCKAGTTFALGCILVLGGIDTETSYSYRGLRGGCRFQRRNVGAKIKKVYKVKPGDELGLEKKVAEGPVAADISREAIKKYTGGVYNKPCKDTKNYSVLVVGYSKDFWILKTSMGVNWGEKGYMKLARNKNNLCGIASSATFPGF